MNNRTVVFLRSTRHGAKTHLAPQAEVSSTVNTMNKSVKKPILTFGWMLVLRDIPMEIGWTSFPYTRHVIIA